MANNWVGVMSSNLGAWGIPVEAKTALQQLAQDAQNILYEAQAWIARRLSNYYLLIAN
jgi:hypothetical protein